MLSLIWLLTLLSLLQYVSALPAALEKRGVSVSQLAQFALFEQYAAAAYCPENNDETGS